MSLLGRSVDRLPLVPVDFRILNWRIQLSRYEFLVKQARCQQTGRRWWYFLRLLIGCGCGRGRLGFGNVLLTKFLRGRALRLRPRESEQWHRRYLGGLRCFFELLVSQLRRLVRDRRCNWVENELWREWSPLHGRSWWWRNSQEGC